MALFSHCKTNTRDNRNPCQSDCSRSLQPPSRGMLVSFLLPLAFCLHTTLLLQVSAQTDRIHVRYGYFPEARPIHAACGRGYFDFYSVERGTEYIVTCYPQTSGGFAASRLDNGQLHIANLGSTPLAQAIARGIDIQTIYISHYMGESQGIYVRPSNQNVSYTEVQTPFDLKNRTIGVPFGSTMHYQVLFLVDLFGLEGSVTLLNLSPSEIIQAWDEERIDAGACWGQAREHMLAHSAKTLVTAADMANWGRPTFVAVAVMRQFAKEHEEFVTHFVSVLTRINDSFLDRLGEVDAQNRLRWDGQQPANISYVPSMVDALMLASEPPQNPSKSTILKKRRVLDLFRQIDAGQQSSCDYFGPFPGACYSPTLLQETLRDTAEFLLDQKIIANLGRMQNMGDANSCQSPYSFCGGDIIDGNFLTLAQRDCNKSYLNKCYPVGLYAANGVVAGTDTLLAEFERLDQESSKSPFALNEVGRSVDGDSTCQGLVKIAGSETELQGTFGDGANAVPGKSYSDNLDCTWEIRSPDCTSPLEDSCKSLVEISFTSLRLWSGDYVRIYSDPVRNSCKPESEFKVLVAQLSGFHDASSLPTFQARGCLLVQLETDANTEKWYGPDSQGDGFAATFDRDVPPCSGPSDCNGFTCNGLTGLCECGGIAYGARCLHRDFCLGTTRLVLSPGEQVVLRSSSEANSSALQSAPPNIVDPTSAYKNDLDCTYDISAPASSAVKVSLFYDLEPTHDLLYLQTGAMSFGQVPTSFAVLTGSRNSKENPDSDAEVYYIPSDGAGYVSLRLITDVRGRRRGFHSILEAVDSSVLYPQGTPCVPLGTSGARCEFDHCIATNQLEEASISMEKVSGAHILGRVVSQVDGLPVQPMPWAPDGGCVWPISASMISRDVENIAALRFVFNSPLDLEPRPRSARGDQLVVVTANGPETLFYMQQCHTSAACSRPWQTGICEEGTCTVQDSVQADINEVSGTTIRLVTDRSDGGRNYFGLDFDVLLVEECPTEEGMKHCENAGSGGHCMNGFCICPGKIPCTCPCEGEPTNVVSINNSVVVVGIVVPLFLIFIGGFLFYRRRKILASRKQKQIIAEKEAELEAFRDSIVGMRVAIHEYVPKIVESTKAEMALSRLNSLRVSVNREPAKVIWCWQETSHLIDNHDPSTIYGDPKDGWVKYDDRCTKLLEETFQKNGIKRCKPLQGYVVDVSTMIQTKEATGFERKVQRVLGGQQAKETKDVDLSSAHFSDGLPKELRGEPQVVLVKDDLIQISKKRDDGWVFGTKLYHADEAVARELVKLACEGSLKPDEANILTDTGWFQEEATAVPSGDDLAALQRKVGNTNALDAPSNWRPVKDPTVAERIRLSPSDPERAAVVDAFMSTVKPPRFNKKAKISKVERIQNLAMWQSYVVKRQTICYRETEMLADGSSEEVQRRAHERFERLWLWHGTNIDVMDKIMQQGFNRSFCGRNATAYGKGVYFARDASYSTYPAYAVPDDNGFQYMMACRVVVGEYCQGAMDALTPEVRDTKTNVLYDSTVGLLSNDTMANPSIYVTYHDAQAYPEYLIKFHIY